jgi:TPP-dependent pyruvate/acetoin dehydrogenase alpha subunit
MTPSNAVEESAPDLLRLYEQMLLIRRMEVQLSEDKAAGNLPGAAHLYIGQEAVAVGICDHLKDTDYITSTHRGHGHFLARGGDPGAMMAEIWGKSTGICQGMGGSMHVADVSKGILGANGIVGGGFAIATGAAFGAKLDKAGAVSVCFFGDGAANQGVFTESMNMSAIWRLPTLFVCENNLYSEFTPSSEITAGLLADRAKAYGIVVDTVDGNDVVAVWKAAQAAVARGRRGEGPTYIEAMTYRIHGHAEAESNLLGKGRYREDAEIERWRLKCPVDRLKRDLIKGKLADEAGIQEIEARVAEVVRNAKAFAETSHPADPELSFSIMFNDQPA